MSVSTKGMELMLISLKGKRCKGCDYRWVTIEDILEREPIKGRGDEVWCALCRKPKTDTVKQRAIYVYPPSLEMAERWKDLARDAGISVSRFIIEHVENSLQQEIEDGFKPRSELLGEVKRLKEEGGELRKQNRMQGALIERLDDEVKSYRSKPFLEEDFHGVRSYNKELVHLLRSHGMVRNDELLENLGVNPQESEVVKAINHQLELLIEYGLIRVVRGGWRWVK